jgi:hypothetical protein
VCFWSVYIASECLSGTPIFHATIAHEILLLGQFFHRPCIYFIASSNFIFPQFYFLLATSISVCVSNCHAIPASFLILYWPGPFVCVCVQLSWYAQSHKMCWSYSHFYFIGCSSFWAHIHIFILLVLQVFGPDPFVCFMHLPFYWLFRLFLQRLYFMWFWLLFGWFCLFMLFPSFIFL